jgi:hypothetical protein
MCNEEDRSLDIACIIILYIYYSYDRCRLDPMIDTQLQALAFFFAPDRGDNPDCIVVVVLNPELIVLISHCIDLLCLFEFHVRLESLCHENIEADPFSFDRVHCYDKCRANTNANSNTVPVPNADADRISIADKIPNTDTVTHAIPNCVAIADIIPNLDTVTHAIPDPIAIADIIPNTDTVTLAIPNYVANTVIVPNANTDQLSDDDC